MTRPIKLSLSTVWLMVLMLSTTTVGQSRGNAGLVLELPASSRAMALGNAYVLGSTDANVLFYNPGAIGGAPGFAVAVQRFATSATMMSAATSNGPIGIGIQALSYGAASPDLNVNPLTLGNIANGGPTGVSELVGTVGYARSILGFEIGIAAKWVEQRIDGDRGGIPVADFGVVREIGPMTFGAALQNIGPDLSVGSIDLSAPYRIGFAAATGVEQVGPLDVAVAGSLVRQHDGGIMAGGGIEVAYWPITGRTFTLRLGAIHEPHTESLHLTLGGAVTLDGVSGTYAFQDLSGPGSSHRVGVSWR